MKMPEWLERATPSTLDVFLGKTASPRKSGLFIRHLCRCYFEKVVDPRSIAALDAADRYEAGEIDELVYRAALVAAEQAAEEAHARAEEARPRPRTTSDPQTGPLSNRSSVTAYYAASHALTATHLALEVETRGYYEGVVVGLARSIAPGKARYCRQTRRAFQTIRLLFFEHFGDIQQPVALDPSWRAEAVTSLAAGIYAERAFDGLPVLADALLDAGCDNEVVLTHCRSEGPHARGCWVIDLLTGRR